MEIPSKMKTERRIDNVVLVFIVQFGLGRTQNLVATTTATYNQHHHQKLQGQF